MDSKDYDEVIYDRNLLSYSLNSDFFDDVMGGINDILLKDDSDSENESHTSSQSSQSQSNHSNVTDKSNSTDPSQQIDVGDIELEVGGRKILEIELDDGRLEISSSSGTSSDTSSSSSYLTEPEVDVDLYGGNDMDMDMDMDLNFEADSSFVEPVASSIDHELDHDEEIDRSYSPSAPRIYGSGNDPEIDQEKLELNFDILEDRKPTKDQSENFDILNTPISDGEGGESRESGESGEEDISSIIGGMIKILE